MREFVDEDQLRLAGERGVEIELAELAAAILDLRERQHVEAFEQRRGFTAAMRFGNADHHVRAFVVTAARGLQHCIGFADARRRAEKNLQPASLTFFFVALQLVEQLIGIGAVHAQWFSSLGERQSLHGGTAAARPQMADTACGGHRKWRPPQMAATANGTVAPRRQKAKAGSRGRRLCEAKHYALSINRASSHPAPGSIAARSRAPRPECRTDGRSYSGPPGPARRSARACEPWQHARSDKPRRPG